MQTPGHAFKALGPQGWPVPGVDGHPEPSAAPHADVMTGEQAAAAALAQQATTIMVRNLPSKITGDDLVAAVRSLGFAGHFDLCFLAVDRVSKSCKGYGFINFDSPAMAAAFCARGHGFHFPRSGMARTRQTEVSVAHTQGVHHTLERLATTTSKKKVKRSFSEQMFVHFALQGSGELEQMTAHRALQLFRQERNAF